MSDHFSIRLEKSTLPVRLSTPITDGAARFIGQRPAVLDGFYDLEAVVSGRRLSREEHPYVAAPKGCALVKPLGGRQRGARHGYVTRAVGKRLGSRTRDRDIEPSDTGEERS